jgi:hypothetical protein
MTAESAQFTGDQDTASLPGKREKIGKRAGNLAGK